MPNFYRSAHKQLTKLKIQIYLENINTISSLKNTNQDVLRSGTSVSHKILPFAHFKNFYEIVKKSWYSGGK